jgi:hypothetical protein
VATPGHQRIDPPKAGPDPLCSRPKRTVDPENAMSTMLGRVIDPHSPHRCRTSNNQGD